MIYVFALDLFVLLNMDVFITGNINYRKWIDESEYFNKVVLRNAKLTDRFSPILES